MPRITCIFVATALALWGAGCGASGNPRQPGSTETNTGGSSNSSGGTVSAGGNVSAGGATTNSGGTETVEPPTSVINPIDYETSCEAEVCTADERCFGDCTFGSCCGKNCGQQLPCPAGEVTFCDRQGGPITCAAP